MSVANSFHHQILACAALAMACTAPALAQGQTKDNTPDEPSYKLTVTSHRLSQSGDGVDVNLRHSSNFGTAWVGYFDANGLDAHQGRAGWEKSFGDTVRWLPSLQIASGGFVGGSLNVEAGKTWFVGAGLGRTNQLPYYNLNYDPNDAVTLSSGYRPGAGASYALSLTKDNRDNPDQQHLHATYRAPLEGGDRLTVDVLFKQGLVNGSPINKVGATITYDWPRFFVRVAFDPNANFSADDVVRISTGLRF
jgi:hypothetical protein